MASGHAGGGLVDEAQALLARELSADLSASLRVAPADASSSGGGGGSCSRWRFLRLQLGSPQDFPDVARGRNDDSGGGGGGGVLEIDLSIPAWFRKAWRLEQVQQQQQLEAEQEQEEAKRPRQLQKRAQQQQQQQEQQQQQRSDGVSEGCSKENPLVLLDEQHEEVGGAEDDCVVLSEEQVSWDVGLYDDTNDDESFIAVLIENRNDEPPSSSSSDASSLLRALAPPRLSRAGRERLGELLQQLNDRLERVGLVVSGRQNGGGADPQDQSMRGGDAGRVDLVSSAPECSCGPAAKCLHLVLVEHTGKWFAPRVLSLLKNASSAGGRKGNTGRGAGSGSAGGGNGGVGSGGAGGGKTSVARMMECYGNDRSAGCHWKLNGATDSQYQRAPVTSAVHREAMLADDACVLAVQRCQAGLAEKDRDLEREYMQLLWQLVPLRSAAAAAKAASAMETAAAGGGAGGGAVGAISAVEGRVHAWDSSPPPMDMSLSSHASPSPSSTLQLLSDPGKLALLFPSCDSAPPSLLQWCCVIPLPLSRSLLLSIDLRGVADEDSAVEGMGLAKLTKHPFLVVKLEFSSSDWDAAENAVLQTEAPVSNPPSSSPAAAAAAAAGAGVNPEARKETAGGSGGAECLKLPEPVKVAVVQSYSLDAAAAAFAKGTIRGTVLSAPSGNPILSTVHCDGGGGVSVGLGDVDHSLRADGLNSVLELEGLEDPANANLIASEFAAHACQPTSSRGGFGSWYRWISDQLQEAQYRVKRKNVEMEVCELVQKLGVDLRSRSVYALDTAVHDLVHDFYLLAHTTLKGLAPVNDSGQRGGRACPPNLWASLLCYVAGHFYCMVAKCAICRKPLSAFLSLALSPPLLSSASLPASSGPRLRPCTDELCLYKFEELGLGASLLSQLRISPGLASLELDLLWAAVNEKTRDVLEPFPSFLLKQQQQTRGRAGWFSSSSNQAAAVAATRATAPREPAGATGSVGNDGEQDFQSNKQLWLMKELLRIIPPMPVMLSCPSEACLKLQLGVQQLLQFASTRSLADVMGDPWLSHRLLRFALSTNRMTLVPLSGKLSLLPSERSGQGRYSSASGSASGAEHQRVPQQFMVLGRSEEQQAMWEERRRTYGDNAVRSFYAFHGSKASNWFSILRNGLRSMSDTKYMSSGASLGTGVYLSSESAMSFGYSAGGLADPQCLACMAICEVTRIAGVDADSDADQERRQKGQQQQQQQQQQEQQQQRQGTNESAPSPRHGQQTGSSSSSSRGSRGVGPATTVTPKLSAISETASCGIMVVPPDRVLDVCVRYLLVFRHERDSLAGSISDTVLHRNARVCAEKAADPAAVHRFGQSHQSRGSHDDGDKAEMEKDVEAALFSLGAGSSPWVEDGGVDLEKHSKLVTEVWRRKKERERARRREERMGAIHVEMERHRSGHGGMDAEEERGGKKARGDDWMVDSDEDGGADSSQGVGSDDDYGDDDDDDDDNQSYGGSDDYELEEEEEQEKEEEMEGDGGSVPPTEGGCLSDHQKEAHVSASKIGDNSQNSNTAGASANHIFGAPAPAIAAAAAAAGCAASAPAFSNRASAPSVGARGTSAGSRSTAAAMMTAVTTAGASKAVQQEFRKIYKLQTSGGNSSFPPDSFSVTLPNEGDVSTWHVNLRKSLFSDSPLAADLETAATRRCVAEVPVVLEVLFGEGFPFDPPFVRVLSPRFAFHTGHVTIGGSICMELLTRSGWSPAYSMEAVLVQVLAEMVAGGARLDPAYMALVGSRGEYTLAEAKAAFQRVAAQHGWGA